ncbi:transposase [Ekhidna sp.]
MIRTKGESEILENSSVKETVPEVNPIRVLNPDRVSKYISLQFSHFFNGYTQAINKQNDRTGKLFELPFRRIEVNNDAYLSMLIYYIHSNPQKHGLIDDFREWPHSSYHSHLSDRPTSLSREEVVEWFGNRKAYLDFHSSFQDVREINSVLLD